MKLLLALLFLLSGLCARLLAIIEARLCDHGQLNRPAFDGALSPQVKRSGPIANNDLASEQQAGFSGSPVNLFSTNHQTAIHSAAGQPIGPQRNALQERALIPHQCIVNGSGAEEGGYMAGGRVENGFGKNEGTRGWRIFQHLIVKPPRVIDAA